MIFKIIFKDEIHRVRADVSDFQGLQKLIEGKFNDSIPQTYFVEYTDMDGDRIRLNCEEDFSIFLEETSDQKSVKIYIKEDLNQTVQTVTTNILEELQEKDSFEQIPEIQKEKVLKESLPKSVTCTLIPEVVEKIISDQSAQKINDTKTSSETNCPGNHGLTSFVASHDKSHKLGVVCDLCDKPQHKGSPIWGCRACDFDACVACYIPGDDSKDAVDELKEMIINAVEKTDNMDWSWYNKICKNCDRYQTGVKEGFCCHNCSKGKKHGGRCQHIKTEEQLQTYCAEVKAGKHQRKHGRGRGKGCKYNWRKHCKGKGKNRQHMKEFMNKKFDEKFENKLREVIPQIAVHVAQILNGQKPPVQSLNPLKDNKIHEKQDQVIHKGFVCDGCGVGPIIGTCYQCSVCKDFDFCSKCEDTIPHAHPFLKLRTPEQRPHAMFMMINEENQKPFVPGQKDQDKFSQKIFEKAQHLFKQFGGDTRENFCKKKQMKCPMMENMCKNNPMMKNMQEMMKNNPMMKNMKGMFDQWKNNMKANQPKVEDLGKISEQLMSFLNVPKELSEGLLGWLKAQKTTNMQELVQKFYADDVLAQIVLAQSAKETQKDVEEFEGENLYDDEPVEEQIVAEKVKVEEKLDDTQVSVDVEESVFIQDENPKETPKVVANDVDMNVLSKVNQLMEIFAVQDTNKDVVQKWVISKNGKSLEELVNLYLYEMMGKF